MPTAQSIRQSGPVVPGHLAVWNTNGIQVDGGAVPGSGGSGGGFSLDPYTTGLSHTVTFAAQQTLTKATSATVGAKAISIPGAAAGNSGYLWVFKLTLGDNTVYTITPSSGTIEGAASFSITDVTKPSVSFISDGSSDWSLWA